MPLFARIRVILLTKMVPEARIRSMANNPPAQAELIEHLCRLSALSPEQARRLILEVLAFYDEPVSEFVRRRHHELQKSGVSNSTIYEQIRQELVEHRFTADPLSTRQIRRAIYG